MKNIRIEKTDTNYVLRPGIGKCIGYGLFAMVGLLIFMITVLTIADDSVFGFNLPSALVVIFLVGIAFVSVYASLTKLTQRLQIDEKGVHLFRLGKCVMDMPWSSIKSCGESVARIRSKRALYDYDQFSLYFSMADGECTDQNSIFIHLEPIDRETIRESGLKAFIKEHFAEKDQD